jgi:hypothetical protein
VVGRRESFSRLRRLRLGLQKKLCSRHLRKRKGVHRSRESVLRRKNRRSARSARSGCRSRSWRGSVKRSDSRPYDKQQGNKRRRRRNRNEKNVSSSRQLRLKIHQEALQKRVRSQGPSTMQQIPLSLICRSRPRMQRQTRQRGVNYILRLRQRRKRQKNLYKKLKVPVQAVPVSLVSLRKSLCLLHPAALVQESAQAVTYLKRTTSSKRSPTQVDILLYQQPLALRILPM